MKNRSGIATVLGLLTSLYSSLVLVDLDTLNYSLPSTYMKLLGLILPAIGGFVSEVKKPVK